MRHVKKLRGGLRYGAAHGNELGDGLGAAAAALLAQQLLRAEAGVGVARDALGALW